MKCTLLLAAETIIVDYNTKRLSAINILESSAVASFPIPIPFMLFVAVERTEVGEREVEVTVKITHEQKEMYKRADTVVFSDGYEIAKNVTNFGTMIIPSPGNLKFEVLSGGVTLKELIVKLSPSSTASPIRAEIVHPDDKK